MPKAVELKPLTKEQQDVVEANQRLVWFVMEEMAKKRVSPLSRKDQFQEGVIGLMRASVGYKPSMGKFSTYAYRAIHNRIQQAEWDSKLIHVPRYLQEKKGKDHAYQPYARRLKRVGEFDAYDKGSPHPAAADECGEREHVANRTKAVAEAFAGLTGLQRKAVEGSIVLGKHDKVLAHELKTSCARIRDARNRAVIKLREKLQQYA